MILYPRSGGAQRTEPLTADLLKQGRLMFLDVTCKVQVFLWGRRGGVGFLIPTWVYSHLPQQLNILRRRLSLPPLPWSR